MIENIYFSNFCTMEEEQAVRDEEIKAVSKNGNADSNRCDWLQAAANLTNEKLVEYQEIFSFFDR